MAKRYMVIDIDIPSLVEYFSAPRPQPFPRHDATILASGEGNRRPAFLNEHFGPGVLAVTVIVHPMTPIVPVVVGFTPTPGNLQDIQRGDYLPNVRRRRLRF